MAEDIADNECVVSGESTVTYRELNERATKIAACLQARGVGAGHVVGISLDRSINMVASVLAVMKCGAAYLPLDPDYPVQRIEYCLTDSGAKILVTSGELASQVPSCRRRDDDHRRRTCCGQGPQLLSN